MQTLLAAAAVAAAAIYLVRRTWRTWTGGCGGCGPKPGPALIRADELTARARAGKSG